MPIMGPKLHPNRARYIGVLRNMTQEQRLAKAIELTEAARALFREGLAASHPGASRDELRGMYLRWMRHWASRIS